MSRKLSKTIVHPPREVRKFDLAKEGHTVGGAAYLETPIDLGAFDYVEEEYLIKGDARVYSWPDANDVPIIVNENGHYCTRIIVRKPSDPQRFSGVVCFESFNGSFTIDHSNAGWGLCCEEILASGDAWVGYTKDGNCLESLRKINPAKYGEVQFPNPLPEQERGEPGWDPLYEYFHAHGIPVPIELDSSYERGLVFDMTFQLNALIKSRQENSPFHGYDVVKTIGIGINDYNTYIAGFQDYMFLPDERPVIDGYLMYMTGGGGWISYHEDMFGFTDPRCSRRCNVPVIRVETSGDLRDIPPHPLWAALWRCEDADEPGNQSRWYEIPGLGVCAAFRQDISCFACEEDYAKLNTSRRDKEKAEKYWNQMCWHIYAGAYHNLKLWILQGILPPKADVIQLTGEYPKMDFVVDEHGNHIGGVRHPYVEVPAARFDDDSTIEMFDHEKLTSLYGTKEAYIEKVRQYAGKMVEERWILPMAVEALVRQAEELEW